MAPTSGTTAGITWRSPLGARSRTRGLFTVWPAACQRKTDSTVSRASDIGRSWVTSASVSKRTRPISASPREARHEAPVEAAGRTLPKRYDGVARGTHGASKVVQIPPPQPFPLRPRAPLLEEQPRAVHVVVRQMLKPDGDLDEPLKRLARGALRPDPVRLQEFVHLEEEPRVEETPRLVQHLRKPRLGRRQPPM